MIKKACLDKPKQKLWIATKDMVQVQTIFNHIKSLDYKDKPNYQLIRDCLKSIMVQHEKIPSASILFGCKDSAEFMQRNQALAAANKVGTASGLLPQQ